MIAGPVFVVIAFLSKGILLSFCADQKRKFLGRSE